MFQTIRYRMILPLGIGFVLTFAALAAAQQPGAIITALTGTASLSVQGRTLDAKIGMTLRPGDAIQTAAGAAATLTLSEGSVINVGENTNLNVDELLQTPEGARKSRLKIIWGKIRMFLAPGHQKEGSEFFTETPNTQVGVKFSQPSVEVSYEPETKTTIVRAYTVEVEVVNRVTTTAVRMPKGNQAMIREEFILITKIAELSSILEQLRRTTQQEAALVKPAEPLVAPLVALSDATMSLLLETQGNAGAGLAGPATSQMPAPGEHAAVPGSGVQPHEFTFTLTEY